MKSEQEGACSWDAESVRTALWHRPGGEVRQTQSDETALTTGRLISLWGPPRLEVVGIHTCLGSGR